MSTRFSLLMLWLILFIVGILLIISGIKMQSKSSKITLIILGTLLVLVSLFLFVFTFFFGFNS